MASPAARPDRPRLTAAEGARNSRRASCAQKPKPPSPQPSPPSGAWGRGSWCGARFGFALGFALAVASARWERAALPGPLWRGGRVEESPQDGSHGCEPVFRRDRSPVEKPRNPPAHPEPMDGRRARHRGAVSLWFLSLWASKEKGTRAPAGARNRFVTCVRRTKARRRRARLRKCKCAERGEHPTPALPCAQGREQQPVPAARATTAQSPPCDCRQAPCRSVRCRGRCRRSRVCRPR